MPGEPVPARFVFDDSERAKFLSDEAILELIMLAGTYRTVSYLVNGLRLPLEAGARRFPAD